MQKISSQINYEAKFEKKKKFKSLLKLVKPKNRKK